MPIGPHKTLVPFGIGISASPHSHGDNFSFTGLSIDLVPTSAGLSGPAIHTGRIRPSFTCSRTVQYRRSKRFGHAGVDFGKLTGQRAVPRPRGGVRALRAPGNAAGRFWPFFGAADPEGTAATDRHPIAAGDEGQHGLLLLLAQTLGVCVGSELVSSVLIDFKKWSVFDRSKGLLYFYPASRMRSRSVATRARGYLRLPFYVGAQ